MTRAPWGSLPVFDQKRRFRYDRRRGHPFITTGLWAWSRHPNCAGEILVPRPPRRRPLDLQVE
ncbi:MAG: DUF1295 domain-containing protein [Acidimicrobiales bacterium]